MEGKQNVPPPMSNAAVLESSKLFYYLNLVFIWDWTIFFCKAFKCVFCLVEYIHHCTETIVLTLKAVFCHGGAYSKVPVHVVFLVFFFVWVWSREEEGQERSNVCVNDCFSPREGHRQAKLIFISNKGWKLEWEGNCQKGCMEKHTLNKASLKCV